MVSIGSSSSSTPNSGKKTSTKELVTVFGGSLLGVGVLLLGVTGIIVALPTPDTSSTMIANEMLTSEQSSRAARQRLQRSKLEKSTWEIERLRRNSIEMLSSDAAAQEARDRLKKSNISGYYSAEAEFVGFRDERCEDERSFLLELLTDRQLNEFIEYINEEYGEDDGEYTYSAETLKKDSCCCGATVDKPCACMSEGVMDCSAVEPKCPCYEAKESFAYESEELIPIGTKVRSYDFWPHDKTCYKEGVIVDHAPSPSCSPGCMHYHIRTTKVVRRGKSRPVEEGEIFMTHPYADPWDQEYPGQLAPHIQSISTAFPSTSTI
jgi:hypothetical protein